MSHKNGRSAARADGLARPAGRRDYGGLAADIRRVRVQLMRPGALGDPRVHDELTELYRQVMAARDERRGRHRLSEAASRARLPAAGPDGRGQIADAPGFALKPDPLTAGSGADLVAALRRFREWAGSPSYREMAERGQPLVAYSTMHKALAGSELPAQKVVVAIVSGCLGSREDVSAFVTAWRQIQAAQGGARPGTLPGTLPGGPPGGRTLRVVPADGG